MNVFEKLYDSQERTTGVTLSHADVSLLFDTLGDAIAKAGAEFQTWRDRLEEYDRAQAREAAQGDG